MHHAIPLCGKKWTQIPKLLGRTQAVKQVDQNLHNQPLPTIELYRIWTLVLSCLVVTSTSVFQDHAKVALLVNVKTRCQKLRGKQLQNLCQQKQSQNFKLLRQWEKQAAMNQQHQRNLQPPKTQINWTIIVLLRESTLYNKDIYQNRVQLPILVAPNIKGSFQVLHEWDHSPISHHH